MKWHLSVPATSANLGPGFDMLGLALDLRLTLKAEVASTYQLELSGYGAEQYPKDASNLVIQAYEYACRTHAWPITNLALKITNPIPVSSGLGSSASAIAIGLALAREVHQQPWDRHQMVREATAIEGHPDNVAPAILGGLIRCDSNGLQTQTHRCQLSPNILVLAATPDEQANTQAMRKILPLPHSPECLRNQNRQVSTLLKGLAEADPEALAISTHDQMHQPYRLALLPKARQLFQLFQSLNAFAGTYLSGSGPTVAGWVLHGKNPSLEVTQQLQQMGLVADVRLLRPDQDGVRREATERVLTSV